jgi:predicted alpha/beta-fold hydrolase
MNTVITDKRIENVGISLGAIALTVLLVKSASTLLSDQVS